MHRKLLNKRILLCAFLFFYQSILDINRDLLLEWYDIFEHDFFQVLSSFQVAKYPPVFLAFYIIHRAFIHSLIVRVYTGKKEMMQLYMSLDLGVFILGSAVLMVRKTLPSLSEITEPITFGFMRLLDSPLLLLLFLPSFYIFKNYQKTAKGEE